MMSTDDVVDPLGDDACFASVARLAGEFRQHALSPVDLIEAVFQRIDRLDRDLGVYVSLDKEGARAAARSARTAIETGTAPGPLCGIPVAVKDTMDVQGLPTTNGSRACPSKPAARDAEVVRRLRQAGAVIVGKANTHEFGLGGTTANALLTTRNPWDPERVPAGSSGGSAAAVAAGMAVAALGGDAGGSVRAPAAWCGVAGLRPTLGLVPGGGVTSISPTIDTIGLLGRRSSDVLAMLGEIVGPKHWHGSNGGELSGTIPEGTVVLVPFRLLHDLCDHEVADAGETAARWYASAGAAVRSLDWPLDLLLDARQAVMSLIAAEAAARLGHLDPNLLGDDVRAVIARGRELGPQVAERVPSVVDRLGRLLGNHFDAGAVVLTPVWPCDPPQVGGGAVWINGRPRAYDEVRSLFTATASLLGLPQAVFNAGFSSRALPIGLQLMGKRYGDAMLLRLASAFEDANDHLQRYPDVG